MPKVAHTDLLNSETTCQLGTDGFNELTPATSQTLNKWRKLKRHIATGWRDQLNTAFVGEFLLTEGVDKAFRQQEPLL